MASRSEHTVNVHNRYKRPIAELHFNDNGAPVILSPYTRQAGGALIYGQLDDVDIANWRLPLGQQVAVKSALEKAGFYRSSALETLKR